MLTIRLQRKGRKNDPSFRVIIVDSKRGPKTGNQLEVLGSYDARSDRSELRGERITYWMSQGAQVSDTVHNLLVSAGIVEGKKRNVLPRKSPPKNEAEEVKAAATPTATPASAPVIEAAAVVEEVSSAPLEVPAEEAAPAAEAAPVEVAVAPETPAEETKTE